MEDNYIIWRGITHAAATAILTDFANEYHETDTVKGLRLYKKQGVDDWLILFSEVPDFDIFSFLINYIYYPNGYKGYSAFIRGYYRTKSILSGRDKIGGNRVMVYISKNNKEYDNVFLTDETGKHFISDFSGGIKRIDGPEEAYVFIAYDLKEYEHVADISPLPKGYRHTHNTRKKPWWKIW
ncbi:hypothetical protein AM493_09655 [Flavobacterium akiainvivens]|uniref:Uncharacterized protein n=1 Tax=Flavobacterium akiainvivens TaxID=1202724 RepID=A0A0M9VI43_9FLAO|nr:hypothetical protein [Flavobacterium akiainvivens]KOS06266.1 hypothetical protein AM493_09655 [Flavobacterium akiainvivens]SFQ17549.1 hypothetical protein SAMN05444144_101434 [Flavobacterium akiainvivens]